MFVMQWRIVGRTIHDVSFHSSGSCLLRLLVILASHVLDGDGYVLLDHLCSSGRQCRQKPTPFIAERYTAEQVHLQLITAGAQSIKQIVASPSNAREAIKVALKH